MTQELPSIFPLPTHEVIRKYSLGDKSVKTILLDGEVIEMDVTRAALDVLQDIKNMRFEESTDE